MKNIKFLFIALILAVAFVACEKDSGVDNTFVLKFERTEVGIAAVGTAVTVTYEVENVAEGATWELTVDNDADWLTIDVAKPNEVTLSATRNEGDDMRRAEVTFGLQGAKSVTLTVIQSGGAEPDIKSVKVEVKSTDATRVTFDVIASHDDLTWIPMVTYAEHWVEPVDDEELFIYDLEYFKYLAENYGVSLEMFLMEMLGVGTQEDITVDRLAPETEYIIYVYGLSKDGQRLTDIAWTRATTTEAWEGDITFEFEVEEEDFNLTYVVTPSHLGVDYYHGIAKESEIEAWKAATGSDDLAAAIQYGDIEYTMQLLIGQKFMDSRADYYDMFNCYDVYEDGWASVDAGTKYIIYAAKWDTECNIIGAVSTTEYTTPEAPLSDNVITLEIKELTQSSVTVDMKTTNDDPYVVMPVKTDVIEGMTDDEIYAFVLSNYSVIVNEYTFSGNWSKTYGRMRPGTDYTLLAFGNLAGVRTTAMTKLNITTPASGDPKDCTFEMLCVPDCDNVWLQIIPSDKGHHYLYEVCPADFTADDVKSFINYVIENDYEGNLAAFSSWRLIQGDYVSTEEGLKPTTDYKLCVVIMDYDTGAFLSDVHFSEVFTTTEMTYADVSITVNWDKYYDAKSLYDAGHTQFGDEGCIVPVSVDITGDYSEYYFAFYNKDLTDEDTYPEDIFYQDLQNNGYQQKSLILGLPYDTLMTATAVVYDMGYNPGKIFRKAVTFTRRGASSASDYEADRQMAPIPASLVVAPEVAVEPIAAEPAFTVDAERAALDARLEAEAESFVNALRKEEAKRIVESRGVVANERRIAR